MQILYRKLTFAEINAFSGGVLKLFVSIMSRLIDSPHFIIILLNFTDFVKYFNLSFDLPYNLLFNCNK